MHNDSVVAEVRRTREALYEENGYDLRRLLDRIRELERQDAARLITLSQLDERRAVASSARFNCM